jgi:WD40 repeat protein
LITACGGDARVRVWHIKRLKSPMLEHSFSSRAYCVCFVGPRQIACGGMFEEITVFDLESKRIVKQLPGTRLANSILFDESRQRLVSGHADGHVRLHSTASWKLDMSIACTVGGVRSLNLSPGAECYLVGTEHGQVNLLDAGACSFIGTLKQFVDQRSIDAVEVSEDLQLLTLSRGVQGLHPVSRTIAVSK